MREMTEHQTAALQEMGRDLGYTVKPVEGTNGFEVYRNPVFLQSPSECLSFLDTVDENNANKEGLLNFLNKTLIPDLRESDNEGMIDTLTECISHMK